jgi:16S rRNA processing protein RimM
MKIIRRKNYYVNKKIPRSSSLEQWKFAVSWLTKMLSAPFFLLSSPAAYALQPFLQKEIRLQQAPFSAFRSGTASMMLPLSVSQHDYDEQTYRSTSETHNSGKRRKRKNKYSNFSKTASFTVHNQTYPTSTAITDKDPWELLMEESNRKNQKLQIEKAKKQNKVKSQDIMTDDNYFAVGKPKNLRKKRKRNVMIFPNTTNIDPYDPTTFGYIELGTILGPHGVRGEVKLSSTTDFAATRICAEKPTIRHLKLPTRRSPREVLLLQGRAQLKDSMYILKLEGIGTREDAMKLKGSTLYAREEEEKPRMEQDEYMISDLVGLDVFLLNDSLDKLDCYSIGTVNGVVLQEDVTSTGSPVSLGYDFLEIALNRAKEEEQQLVMIPFVPQIVPHVDITEQQCIYINPPKGLLDLTFVRRERVIIKGFLPPAKD